MSAAIEALIREQRALLAALDADDIDGIAQRSAGVEQAIVRIRSLSKPVGNRALAEESLRLADAARVRINVLSDITQRRLTRLAVASGRGTAAPTYGRNARLKT